MAFVDDSSDSSEERLYTEAAVQSSEKLTAEAGVQWEEEEMKFVEGTYSHSDSTPQPISSKLQVNSQNNTIVMNGEEYRFVKYVQDEGTPKSNVSLLFNSAHPPRHSFEGMENTMQDLNSNEWTLVKYIPKSLQGWDRTNDSFYGGEVYGRTQSTECAWSILFFMT